MSIRDIRETRQFSMINQILTYIEESLKNLKKNEMQDEMQDVVMIDLSAYDLDNDDVREMIHVKYETEIIGKNMFIKYDGILKQRIHRKLANSAEAHNPNWDVDANGMCVLENRDSFLPDVGIWFQMPTKAERVNPIKERCPLPDVWIEVFYNRDPDRIHALDNIALVQQLNLGIEFVGISLPYSTVVFQQNPNPGIATTPVTPSTNQNIRTTRAPYIIHWNVNSVPVYYKMNWNQHIVLRCGWVLDFNIVLNVLAM
ncbi:hypothetical protein RhiirA1_540690 [Rhizophagus irregularis]|uniref:Uncharacterized protein n=1 Tax=Rhizophagus irregularis TaxID=588596 RepID=A0A2N0R6Z8_9GLOM|nr:hypothetical protein RhiirA1_540690 [Rhizophagus irregularis]CAB4479652.1 unnamed protein product [Rhizophagus irregularis]